MHITHEKFNRKFSFQVGVLSVVQRREEIFNLSNESPVLIKKQFHQNFQTSRRLLMTSKITKKRALAAIDMLFYSDGKSILTILLNFFFFFR